MPPADRNRIDNPERLAKLRSLNLLDAPDDPSLDRLTWLASKILHAPISLVSILDANRQYFVSQFGLDGLRAATRQTPLEQSFCQHVLATNEPLIVEDARQHPLAQDSPLIKAHHVIAYAGIPLITATRRSCWRKHLRDES